MFRTIASLAVAASLLFGCGQQAAQTPNNTQSTMSVQGHLEPAKLKALNKYYATLMRSRPVGTLTLKHLRHGKLVETRHYQGKVTNVGVAILASLMAGTMNSGGVAGIANFKYSATGTGTGADAATDYGLGTPITSLVSSCITNTPSDVSVAGTAKYQTQGTFAYNGGFAVTEWALYDTCTGYPWATSGSGSPLTAATAAPSSAATVTGTPLSANAQAGMIIVAPTTTPAYIGIVINNDTSHLSITPAGWVSVSNDAAATAAPTGNATYFLQGGMLDRKNFAAINVVSGDSIQFTYGLTLTAGS